MDFFKLMNNGVLSDTMEAVREHKNVKVVNGVETRSPISAL